MADETGHAGTDSDAFNYVFTHSTDAQTSPGQSQAASNIAQVTTYSYDPVCIRGNGISGSSFYGCGEVAPCGSGGSLYWIWATHPDGTSEIVGQTCIEPDDPIAAQVITPGAIYRAFKRIPLPKTPLIVQPVGGTTLVNFDTVLHTDAASFTRTVRLLGRRITFDITPSQFTWHLGHGATLTTDDPGRPYQAGLPTSAYVSYRYPKAGQESLHLTTTWTARWRTGGGPWRDVDGTVQTNTPTQDLHVTTATPDLISYD